MILIEKRPVRAPKLNMEEAVKCTYCGWEGKIAGTIQALWIDPNKRTPPPIGDGYNLRCPECKTKVKTVRYAD